MFILGLKELHWLFDNQNCWMNLDTIPVETKKLPLLISADPFLRIVKAQFKGHPKKVTSYDLSSRTTKKRKTKFFTNP